MLLHQGKDQDRILAALAFVHRDGIGEREVSQVPLLDDDSIPGKFNLERTVSEIRSGYDPQVPVVHSQIIVIPALDDFITDRKKTFPLHSSPVQSLLDLLVKVRHADGEGSHGS